MTIISNLALPPAWTSSGGCSGTAVCAKVRETFIPTRRQPDTVWLVNCDPSLTFSLAALPHQIPPLITVDIVLRRPHRLVEYLALPAKRALLGRVAHFIHYFTDLDGYRQVYGIGPERSSFVPFKPNIRRLGLPQPNPDGEYILCFGRSLRDFDTFFDAMELLPYPGAIPRPDVAQLRSHGARFTRTLDQLPANVRLLEDDGSDAALLRIMQGAKIVAIPTVRTGMVASISVALNAMLLGKCVVGSEGPGMSDIFNDKVLTAPPEEPAALAAMLNRAWLDDELRQRNALVGHEYAASLGGEAEFQQRILDRVCRWYKGYPRRSK